MTAMILVQECRLVTANFEAHCEYVTIIDQEDHRRLPVEAIAVEKTMDLRVDMTTMTDGSAAGVGQGLHIVVERMADTGRGA